MIQLTENDRVRTFGFVRRLAGCVEDVVARSLDEKAGMNARGEYERTKESNRGFIQDPEGGGELAFGGSVNLWDLPPCPIIVYSRVGKVVIPPPHLNAKEG